MPKIKKFCEGFPISQDWSNAMFTFGLLKLRGVVKFFLVVVKPYLRNQLRVSQTIKISTSIIWTGF